MEGRVNVTVEPGANFTSARGFSYIASILFTQLKITPATVEVNPQSSGSHCIGPEESI